MAARVRESSDSPGERSTSGTLARIASGWVLAGRLATRRSTENSDTNPSSMSFVGHLTVTPRFCLVNALADRALPTGSGAIRPHWQRGASRWTTSTRSAAIRYHVAVTVKSSTPTPA